MIKSLLSPKEYNYRTKMSAIVLDDVNSNELMRSLSPLSNCNSFNLSFSPVNRFEFSPLNFGRCSDIANVVPSSFKPKQRPLTLGG